MDKSELLGGLYQARLDDLKAMANQHNLPKTGSVEALRSRLIQHTILGHWNLTKEGIKEIPNAELGELLGVFGIKKSGSIKARRQRMYLHLYHDPKQLTTDNLDMMTRDEIHALCKELALPLSGNKQSLLVRVAGVLASQENAWGKVKKSLRRPRDKINIPEIPFDDEEQETLEVEDVVDQFVDDHKGEWSFEEETTLREDLVAMGHSSSQSSVSASIDGALRTVEATVEPAPPPMIQDTEIHESHSLETETALMELQGRMAEINALARDFLMVSSTTNQDDLKAFIASLQDHGFASELPPVSQSIANTVMELDFQMQQEANAAHAMPQSWSEREALRGFEQARSTLRDHLENLLSMYQGDTVKARMAFEHEARSMGLDLRIPSVSGRLHALFDLHIEIAETQALHDPIVLRRQRMMRILHHGAVHLQESERSTIARLERSIGSFEELVQTVLESSEHGFEEPQQALVIRFLESKGYEVNTVDLRPRILACAGIIGAELGYLSPSDIPRIAPGVLVSETEVDAIVTELKALAQSFKTSDELTPPEEEEVAESVIEASENITRVRGKIDRVDELLNRLRG
ncbi:MAG: hypothetical protein CMA10_03710 [Euryarchaeota archaeon]|nr:hypothetical protein [Euryarchaeota archaeon]|tara:strand:- start:6647 stop:8383 length:1737 start_codon:yes stop_codon:yes gene_type:complete